MKVLPEVAARGTSPTAHHAAHARAPHAATTPPERPADLGGTRREHAARHTPHRYPHATGRALFDSVLGPCGLAWNEHALTWILLPGRTRTATAALLAEVSGAAPALAPPWPAFVADAVAGMQALLAGGTGDLSHVPIELEGIAPFEREVYEATRRLAPGHTCTYGELARAIGHPHAARAVGAALGRNPWPLVVPCHRVLGAGGRMVGFSAPGGVKTKRRLLEIEGAALQRPGELF